MLEADLLGGGLRAFPTLRGSHSCDVMIVGGGIVGLITACIAAERGLSVMLAEARRLGSGSSAGCMGIAASWQHEAYSAAARFSMEAASSFAKLTMAAVSRLNNLIESWRIACALRCVRFVRYAVTREEAERLAQDTELAGRLQVPFAMTKDHGDCPVPVRLAAETADQVQFDAARLFSGLIDTAVRLGVSIYEYSPVRAFRREMTLTEEGSVTSQHVILTTGWPIGMQDPAQLMLLRQEAYFSMRLIGGAPCYDAYEHAGRERLRMASSPYGLEASCWLGMVGSRAAEKHLASSCRMVYSQLNDWSILHESVQPCVASASGLPLIGPLQCNNPRILAASGFGRNGVVQSVLAADMLIRHIKGNPLPESVLFHPCGAYHQHAAARLPSGELRLRTATAKLRQNRPMCPHMGCRMRWNEERQLWECPCHGSSFTPRGECLTAPAMEHASIPERLWRD